MKYSKKMMRAAEEQIYFYDQLILDLAEWVIDARTALDRWSMRECHFCSAAKRTLDGDVKCGGCLIGYPGAEDGENPCINSGELGKTYAKLWLTGGWDGGLMQTTSSVLEDLRRRRDALLRQMEKNGVVLK